MGEGFHLATVLAPALVIELDDRLGVIGKIEDRIDRLVLGIRHKADRPAWFRCGHAALPVCRIHRQDPFPLLWWGPPTTMLCLTYT